VLDSFLLDRSSRVDGAIAGAGSILIHQSATIPFCTAIYSTNLAQWYAASWSGDVWILEGLSQLVYKVTGTNQLIYISKYRGR